MSSPTSRSADQTPGKDLPAPLAEQPKPIGIPIFETITRPKPLPWSFPGDESSRWQTVLCDNKSAAASSSKPTAESSSKTAAGSSTKASAEPYHKTMAEPSSSHVLAPLSKPPATLSTKAAATSAAIPGSFSTLKGIDKPTFPVYKATPPSKLPFLPMLWSDIVAMSSQAVKYGTHVIDQEFRPLDVQLGMKTSGPTRTAVSLAGPVLAMNIVSYLIAREDVLSENEWICLAILNGANTVIMAIFAEWSMQDLRSQLRARGVKTGDFFHDDPKPTPTVAKPRPQKGYIERVGRLLSLSVLLAVLIMYACMFIRLIEVAGPNILLVLLLALVVTYASMISVHRKAAQLLRKDIHEKALCAKAKETAEKESRRRASEARDKKKIEYLKFFTFELEKSVKLAAEHAERMSRWARTQGRDRNAFAAKVKALEDARDEEARAHSEVVATKDSRIQQLALKAEQKSSEVDRLRTVIMGPNREHASETLRSQLYPLHPQNSENRRKELESKMEVLKRENKQLQTKLKNTQADFRAIVQHGEETDLKRDAENAANRALLEKEIENLRNANLAMVKRLVDFERSIKHLALRDKAYLQTQLKAQKAAGNADLRVELEKFADRDAQAREEGAAYQKRIREMETEAKEMRLQLSCMQTHTKMIVEDFERAEVQNLILEAKVKELVKQRDEWCEEAKAGKQDLDEEVERCEKEKDEKEELEAKVEKLEAEVEGWDHVSL